MYKYMYARASAEGIFVKSNYKELIEKYSKEGWRFITAIPCDIGGRIEKFDLVFEKEEE